MKQAILDAHAARLAKAVAAGRITADQRSSRLAALGTRVDTFVARVWASPVLKRLGKLVGRFTVAETAKALNLKRGQVRQQARGTSLSALITAKGGSPAAVKAAVLARFDASLDKVVANNRVSRTNADAMLAKLGERVDKALARTHPA